MLNDERLQATHEKQYLMCYLFKCIYIDFTLLWNLVTSTEESPGFANKKINHFVFLSGGLYDYIANSLTIYIQ